MCHYVQLESLFLSISWLVSAALFSVSLVDESADFSHDLNVGVGVFETLSVLEDVSRNGMEGIWQLQFS